MKTKFVVALALGLAITLVAGASLFSYADSNPDSNTLTEGEARDMAEQFVENSLTYQFDGSNLEYKETLYPDVVDCSDCWTFVFEFESAHGGYSDRTEEMVTQVITPHEAHVTIEDGEIVSAVLDLKWDMINQKMIEE